MPIQKIRPATNQYFSFTTKFSHRTNVLITETKIGPSFNPQKTRKVKDVHLFNAIWDTGATNTVITKSVARKCNLKPTGMTKVRGISGEAQVHTYLVSITLRNDVCLPQVRVTEGIISNADVLIGMDIINRGDFAVTNSDGRTTLSFRTPSLECLDFVKQSLPVIPKVGRNEPCPCNSGKKYKYCCGKRT